MSIKIALEKLRSVRLVITLSVCYCLRSVTRSVLRSVRSVTTQVFEIIALGNFKSAAPRALYTTYIPGRLPWGPPAPVCVSVGSPRMTTNHRSFAHAHPRAAFGITKWPVG